MIQSGSTEFRPLDFHSFRRAYANALGASGVNVQTAMRLSGHRNASTHMRYVRLAETLETPAAALPVLRGVPTLPARHRSAPRTDGSKRAPREERIQDDSRSRFRDLNSRRAVYETAALPLS